MQHRRNSHKREEKNNKNRLQLSSEAIGKVVDTLQVLTKAKIMSNITPNKLPMCTFFFPFSFIWLYSPTLTRAASFVRFLDGIE
jgi:hypothetical protein